MKQLADTCKIAVVQATPVMFDKCLHQHRILRERFNNSNPLQLQHDDFSKR